MDDYCCYRYHADVDRVGNGFGCIHNINDLRHIVDKLQEFPDILVTKPKSIQILEKLTGIPAVLNYRNFGSHFGSWLISREEEFYLCNNPMQLPDRWSSSEDDFEVWFDDFDDVMKHDFDNPIGEQSVEEVIEMLGERGLNNDEWYNGQFDDCVNDEDGILL